MKDVIRQYKLSLLGYETYLTSIDMEVLDILIPLLCEKELSKLNLMCSKTFYPKTDYIYYDQISNTHTKVFYIIKFYSYQMYIDGEYFKYVKAEYPRIEELIINIMKSHFNIDIKSVIFVK